MELRMVAGDGCGGSTCPAVFLSDRGTVVIQGARVSETVDVAVPEHEVLAEVPLALIQDLIRSGEVA